MGLDTCELALRTMHCFSIAGANKSMLRWCSCVDVIPKSSILLFEAACALHDAHQIKNVERWFSPLRGTKS